MNRLSVLLLFITLGCLFAGTTLAFDVPFAVHAPVVDGEPDDTAWARADWTPIDKLMLGSMPEQDDFSGRYKLVWTTDHLYLLAEITDDILYDSHPDPLELYWEDDTLEIFIDADASGGDHLFNYNAFAYHISLDNQAIDIGTDKQPHNYSHHVDSRWRQQGNKIVWELAIDIYTDEYVDGSGKNERVALSASKLLRLMIAYCDNDGSELRENFIGSEAVHKGPKDRGWIDAGIFGSLILVEAR